MKKAKSFLLALAGVGLFSLFAEGPSHAISGFPTYQSSEACYHFTSHACFETAIWENMGEEQPDYLYRDSFNDPSFPGSFNPAQYIPPIRFINLHLVSGREPIADNFILEEFTAAWKGSYGVFSAPVVEKIQTMRSHFARPLVIHSGFRSPGYNDSIDGSATWSRHVYGDAIDFHIKGVSFEEIARICRNQGAAFTQIYRTHIHCDWRTTNLDPNFYDPVLVSEDTYHEHHEWASSQDADHESHESALSQNPDHEHPASFSVEMAMSEMTKINVSPHAADSQQFTLSYQTWQEDGGELQVEWKITHPVLGEYISKDQTITVPKEAGTYQVHLNLGGSVTIKRDLNL